MKTTLIAAVFSVVALLSSCGGKADKTGDSIPGDTLTSRAELLTLIERGGYVAAIVADPWNPGKRLASYALVPRGTDVPAEIPEGFQIVEVPLQRSVVYSSTNTAALAELSVLDAVAAVADGNYYTPADTVARLIASGHITDIGNSMSPKLETLIEVSPDAILSSPYENAGHGVLDALKVPVIECADYMESTPLGRAEWILFLGHLYGKAAPAGEIYSRVVSDYSSLTVSVALYATRQPKVLTETLTSGVWYVPGGKSYMARMLADAGANYPWSDDSSSGSLQLDAAAVIDKASDADIWIMRISGTPTYESLRDSSPLYSGIKAYADGEIYNCDPSASTFFSDIAFHPERILRDYVAIFHPEAGSGLEPIYYHKLKR